MYKDSLETELTADKVFLRFDQNNPNIARVFKHVGKPKGKMMTGLFVHPDSIRACPNPSSSGNQNDMRLSNISKPVYTDSLEEAARQQKSSNQIEHGSIGDNPATFIGHFILKTDYDENVDKFLKTDYMANEI